MTAPHRGLRTWWVSHHRGEVLVAALIALGIPLWLIVGMLLLLFHRNRLLRRREGNVPVRLRATGESRWDRGHAVWVSDVLAYRSSPAAWRDLMLPVDALAVRPVTGEDGRQLGRLGQGAVVATLTVRGGPPVEVAAAAEHAAALCGPYAPEATRA